MKIKKLQPALIGAFVVLSFFLFAVAIVLFGGGRFFDSENTVIAYFDGSLQGLSVGAPVTYRGVTIGQVKEIKIHIKQFVDEPPSITIPVLISLIPGKSVIVDGKSGNASASNNFLEAMCRRGLRAKLKLQSLVTGKLYIDLAFYNNTTPVYRDEEGTYLEIPTLPSEMYQLSQVVENMKFGELYKKAMSTFDAIESLSTGLNDALHSDQTRQLADELSTTMTRLNSILAEMDNRISPLLQQMDRGFTSMGDLAVHADQVVTRIDTKLNPFLDELTTTATRLDQVLAQASRLVEQARTVIQPTSPLYFRLTEAMRQLEQTARAIRNLSNFLHRNPEALLQGLQTKEGNSHAP